MNMDIYEMMFKRYKINKPIRLIELFAGYGSQALALKYLGVKFEHWKISEWAVNSIQAYKDVHFQDDNKDYSEGISKDYLVKELCHLGISRNYNEPMSEEQINRLKEKEIRKIYNNIIATHNLVNIQRIEWEDLEIEDTNEYDYIMTYSFPCQDLSLAGKGKGMKDNSTRSGMLWEVERILNELHDHNSLPQVLLMENVPQVHGTDNIKDFNKWQLRLEELGYKNYTKDLIATDYGIPQTRNRCFMISVLGDYYYAFPKPIPLELKLKDMLEKNVEEKYYLSDKMLDCFLKEQSGNYPRKKRFEQSLNKVNEQQIANTITTLEGNRDISTFIKIPEATKKGYAIAEEGDGIYINRPHQKRGVVQKDKIQTIKTSCDDIGVVVEGNNIYDLFFAIFDLCIIINKKEKDKYERSRKLLQILWQEIGKKEIWQEIRRFVGIQEKKILQSNLHENGIYENRKLQSRISSGTSNSKEYNENITNREKMLNMWEDWKTRYTPQRWELSKQQFREFNLFMQKLSFETTQRKAKMQDMWQTNERFRILQQTLFKIQEIWKPTKNKISNGLRIRKLSPLECWRLMGVKDEDFEKVRKNQSDSSLYHLAGDSIVVNVLMAIFKQIIE